MLINTAAMLEELGHTVSTASSGEEALSLLRAEWPVDLLITDQIMPQMSGSVLLAEARRTRPGLPVLLATGYAEVDPVRAPATPRLAKPFPLDDLRQSIIETMT